MSIEQAVIDPRQLSDLELSDRLEITSPGAVKNSLAREKVMRRLAAIKAVAQQAVGSLGDDWKDARIAADGDRIIIDRSGEGV